MKRCAKCGELKDESEFSKSSRSKDGLASACKSCKHEFYVRNAERIKMKSKLYYESHKEQAKASAKNNRKKNKEKRKPWVEDIKTDCVKCGDTRKYLIDFHHINSADKQFNIGEQKSLNQALFNEVKKCVCLCRNCHFEFHYLYGNQPIDPVSSLTEYLGVEPYTLTPKCEVLL